MVVATLHKISAGDGYLYYTQQVAAQDVSSRGATSLSDYYSSRGEAPGRWYGAGLPGLTVTYRDETIDKSIVDAGSPVTEDQMRALFGQGQHPNTGEIRDRIIDLEVRKGAPRRHAVRAADRAALLGAPFRIYSGASEYRKRCATAFADHNGEVSAPSRAAIPDETRSRIRTEIANTMFREQLSRPPLDQRELSGWVARNSRLQINAVAGFDWTFSPVKSVSALWALAPREVSDTIAAAHRAATEAALQFLEQHATFTRLGRNGIRQVDVDGLVCAAFDHRDSRAGDPNLHTHVVVANRVRTGDGRWRTLDGAMFYRFAVSASEIYNTTLEIELLRRFEDAERGRYHIEFAAVPARDPTKRPVREIVGIAPELIEFWSKRVAAISARTGELTAAFEQTHGREPRPDELHRITQQATLDTRPAKKSHRSLAEQREQWWQDAVTVLRGPDRVARMLAETLHPRLLTFPVIDSTWIAERADEVIATVSGERSTWQYPHVRSEVERVVRGRITDRKQWAVVTAHVVSQALAPTRSIARGDPDIAAQPVLRDVPVMYRRRDGTNFYTTVASQSYTTPETLAVEARLVELFNDTGARAVDKSAVDTAVSAYHRDPAHGGRRLNQGQIAVIDRFAGSGRRFDVANAPAGTGKTTAMGVLADAWRSRGGTVLGLAPTAAAARDLGADIRARTDTLDKLLAVLDAHTPTSQCLAESPDPATALPQWVLDIDDRTLVIIDEHARIVNRKRLQAMVFLMIRGASVRFLGDIEQLPAIGAGGAAADIVDAADAITLSNVVRFAEPAEGAATLLLREGDPAGFGFHLDRGRIHAGSPTSMADAAYAAWSADIVAGLDAVLLAPTHALVGELNDRARADRLARAGTEHGAEITLPDGLAVSAGDTICTTSNERGLAVGTSGDFVRNGYRWLVTGVATDGGLSATRLAKGRASGDTVILPPGYVGAHVRLGYASTIDSVQGITADTCHTVLRGIESRAQLYVALTRGRLGNHLYLTTTLDGSNEGAFYSDIAAHPRTALEILIAILSRDRAHTSAHSELREALDPLTRLGRATDVFVDAVGVATEHTLGADTMHGIDTAAERLYPGLTGFPAWPVLRQHLATLALDGRDPTGELARAIAARELGTANDAAAVLDWRLDSSSAHSTAPRPLPWLPSIPDAVRANHRVAAFLDARQRLITTLADGIRASAHDFTPLTAPAWARPLLGADPRLIADLAVWRAAHHVPAADTRPTGSVRYIAVERRHQLALDARVTEVIGDVHLPATKWEPVIKRIEARVLADPFWPILADRLETASLAGIDVEAMLDTAAHLRPLPDELAAAALWSRLDLDPAALSGASPLTPDWLPELIGVFGSALSDRIAADPAWPKVVAAVEAAEETAWIPLDILTTAGELLAGDRGDSGVRPDQLTTALAWCIDAIAHHVPTAAPPQSAEPPPAEPPFPDPQDPLPEPAPLPEVTVMSEPEPPESGPAPPLAEGIHVVAELFRLGEHRNGSMELSRVLAEATEEERRTVMRVEATLRRYPFVIARARLHAAARYNPHLGELIRACIPVTNPHIYREASATLGPTPVPAPPVDVTRLQWTTTPAEEAERRTLRRILKTLEQFPFPEAQRRLHAAARELPEHSEFILRHIPEADPGLHQPPDPAHGHTRPWTPPSQTRSRIDPSRRIPPERQSGASRVAEDYFAEQPDHYLTQPTTDDRSRYDAYSAAPPATSTAHADSRKPPRPVRLSGIRREYDGGPFEPNLENLRGLACVSCMLERPVADTGTMRSTHHNTADDGLCTDCREAGHPGIPDHAPADYVSARCQFITDTHGPEGARVLLRRDFRNSPVLSLRVAIAEWVAHNLPAPAPDQNTGATAAEHDPLITLTDAALDKLALDLRQRIGLADTDAIVTDSPHPSQRAAASNDDLEQMQAAVTAARDAQSIYQDISAQLQASRSALRDATARLETTPRFKQADNNQLKTELASLTRTRDDLEAQLGYARRTAREAHRDATLQAGPETGWDQILQSTAPTTADPATPPQQDETDSNAAAEHAARLKQRWQRDLDAVDNERQRRSTLTPEQHSREQQLRNQPKIEANTLHDTAHEAQTALEVDQPDAGM
ncbi:MAG: relaxase domain-containing protein [Mycobacterium sp.]|nr:relaxase domain-containing protein [Mycobacterium sp.]